MGILQDPIQCITVRKGHQCPGKFMNFYVSSTNCNKKMYKFWVKPSPSFFFSFLFFLFFYEKWTSHSIWKKKINCYSQDCLNQGQCQSIMVNAINMLTLTLKFKYWDYQILIEIDWHWSLFVGIGINNVYSINIEWKWSVLGIGLGSPVLGILCVGRIIWMVIRKLKGGGLHYYFDSVLIAE